MCNWRRSNAAQATSFSLTIILTPAQSPDRASIRWRIKTYADLLDRLQKNDFASVSPELRTTLLTYYGDLNAPFATKKDKKEWAKVVRNVNQLKASHPAEPPAARIRLPKVNSPTRRSTKPL